MKVTVTEARRQKLKPSDIARIMLGSEPFATYGFSRKSCNRVAKHTKNLFIAKVNQQIVGFAIYETQFLNGYYLKLIAVDSNTRGLGVGTKLMDALEKATFKKHKALYLCVTDFNRRAQKFYHTRGYERVGVLKNHFKKGINEILMRKVR